MLTRPTIALTAFSLFLVVADLTDGMYLSAVLWLPFFVAAALCGMYTVPLFALWLALGGMVRKAHAKGYRVTELSIDGGPSVLAGLASYGALLLTIAARYFLLDQPLWQGVISAVVLTGTIVTFAWWDNRQSRVATVSDDA